MTPHTNNCFKSTVLQRVTAKGPYTYYKKNLTLSSYFYRFNGYKSISVQVNIFRNVVLKNNKL